MQSSCLSKQMESTASPSTRAVKGFIPFDDLAASVLGFVNAYDNRGAYGLESYYNKIRPEARAELFLLKTVKMVKCPFSMKSCMNRRTETHWC